MSDLCDTFSLYDLLNEIIFVKSQHGTSIDLILTNSPISFQNTSLIETGLSDYHKITLSVFKGFL